MSKLQILRENFSTEIDCQRYLAELKWADGYKCRKCGHERYCKGRKHYYRKCLNCHFDESPTSGTLFHKIKFSLVQAFEIIYWTTQTTKGMSSAEIGKHFGIHQTSAWRFRRKVQQAMKDLGGQKLLGMVEVDGICCRKRRKEGSGEEPRKKAIGMVGIETTTTRKGKKGIKKIYCQTIEGYGSEDFRPFFVNRIDPSSRTRTDKWTGYLPLRKEYNIKMMYSKKGKNFKELHNVILNLKSWLRGIHHSVCNWHLQGYLDEFSFRYNYKNDFKTGWKILIENMMVHPPVYAKNLFYGN